MNSDNIQQGRLVMLIAMVIGLIVSGIASRNSGPTFRPVWVVFSLFFFLAILAMLFLIVFRKPA